MKVKHEIKKTAKTSSYSKSRPAKESREQYQLKEWMREEKTTSVPPSKGVISNFGFFSKHLFTDFVRISIICHQPQLIKLGMATTTKIFRYEAHNEIETCVSRSLYRPQKFRQHKEKRDTWP